MEVSGSDRYLDDDFTAWLNALLLRDHVPGMSIAVIKDGHVECAGFGLARLPNTQATADTIYPMASTTKAFTTALMGLLIGDESNETPVQQEDIEKQHVLAEKGWKTPVSWILPGDFKTTSKYITRTATIEDIASHRSGIAGHDIVWGPVRGISMRNTTHCLRHLETDDDRFRAGWQYNNLMYGVLGDILEMVSGKDFVSMLQERILKPLVMGQTWLGIERLVDSVEAGQLQKERIARGYYWHEENSSDQKEKNGYYVPEPYTSLMGCEPAGALISTVSDFAKWVLALLDGAKSKEPQNEAGDRKENYNSLISNALWQELTTPRIQIVPLPFPSTITPSRPNDHATPLSYALGWVVDSYMYPGEVIISHGGGLPGFGTGVVLVPDHDFGLVTATNGGMSNAVCEAVAKELIGRRLGISKEQRRKHVEQQETPSTTQDDSSESSSHTHTSASPPSAIAASSLQLEGKYFNAAYNTMSLVKTTAEAGLSVESPCLHGVKIVRKDQKVPKSHDAPFLITPLGKRGVRYRLLLHPLSKQTYADKILYTLETLISCGDLVDDPAPMLEKGYGHKGDPKYPGKDEPVWQSLGIKDRAAVFEVVKGAKEQEHLVAALGLRVMRVDGDMDKDKKGHERNQGTLKNGWQDEMIWFHKS